MSRYFMDTEFIESGPEHPLHLVSIGIVADDGREFYAINADAPLAMANDWVKANVLPHLDMSKAMPRAELVKAVLEFINAGEGKPEVWGYYADYDWVVFAQLFGTMIALPEGWPMYCRDLKQWCDQLGNPKLPEQGKDEEHHALNDARWIRTAFQFLQDTALQYVSAFSGAVGVPLRFQRDVKKAEEAAATPSAPGS